MTALEKVLREFPDKLKAGVLRKALGEAMEQDVKPEARARVRKASGKLAAGLMVETSIRPNSAVASLITTGPHAHIARWLEFGVKAHIIRAKRGKGLRFKGKQGRDARGRFMQKQWAFARFVPHPGFFPKKFMRPALDAKSRAVWERVAKILEKELAQRDKL